MQTYYFTFIPNSTSLPEHTEIAGANRLCDAKDVAVNGLNAWLAGYGYERKSYTWGPWGLTPTSSS